MIPRSGPLLAAFLAGLVSPPLAAAQPGPGWGGPYPPSPYYEAPFGAHDSRQGRIEVATFLASSSGISALGHGPILVSPPAGAASGGLDDAAYETALVSELAKAGYELGAQPGAGGQIVEFVVSHDVIEPPQPPHNPVSGEVAVGGGNRGSGVGLALAIDLSKPLGALVATRLEARIRSAATRELLWQGRAEVLFRDGDKHWKNEAVAAKLAAALFKGFPRPQSH